MKTVVKRDGSYQSLKRDKIRRAILAAFHDCQKNIDRTELDNLVALTIQDDDRLPVEEIQDRIEKLLAKDHFDVARSYILYREQRTQARQARETPDPMELANYIHASKYARWKGGRRETYPETVTRVMNMHLERYPHLKKEIEKAFSCVFDKRVLPSMRSMQFAGEAVAAHHARMYNCSFTLIDRPRAFQEIFYLLLCGCGVGFSVQWQHVEKLKRIVTFTRKVRHHTVEDSIEGWANALGTLIHCAIGDGDWVEFDYSEIRPEGAPLETSGGKAPGHIPLRECLEKVRAILRNAQNRKLRPIECHDIICHVAEAVLAGGIRRSSLISLFSVTDTEMMYAKVQGNFHPEGINSQRMMANNSAVLDRSKVQRSEFDRIIRIAQEGWGEPGFFFTRDTDHGTNPCGEIGLDPTITYDDLHWARQFPGPSPKATGFAFCNLTEINCAKFQSETDFLVAAEAAAVIGTLQAGFTDFPYLGHVTEAIAKRDALIGVGLTGMVDAPMYAFDPALQEQACEMVVKTNRRIAKLMNIKPAARCTTVKPSGTASLALGCVGSGIHPHHSKRYFRRVTANPLENPARFFEENNPHAIEYKSNGDWSLVFPVCAPEGAITVKEQKALEFMRTVIETYRSWVRPGTTRGELTHNVSATVTVRDGEIDEVIDYIWKHRGHVAAISFAPYTLDMKFPHAPREEVTDDRRWNELIRMWKRINWHLFEEASDGTQLIQEAACVGGACEV